jgi:predicted esterase
MKPEDLSLQSISLPPWEILLHKPPSLSHTPLPVLFLLHGWTGDETKMWVFTRHLQKSFIIVALRGLFPTPQGGFGWYELQKLYFLRL